MQTNQLTVGFIGTGVMGKSMATHILKAGHNVLVYTRTAEKAQDLIANGAVWKTSVADLAAESDVVITMVGYPKDVEELYLGEHGIVHSAKEGTYIIDMTTSSPLLAAEIYKQAKAKNIHSLDAPVSGGDIGARNAALSIMVGGDSDAFETMEPLFHLMGTNIIRQGDAGAGQHTKMCNQIAIASNMMGVCEALVYAEKNGLDRTRVLQSIQSGAAGSWSLTNLAPRIIGGDFEPGFYVKHFIKDMKIALEVAEEMDVQLPGLQLAHQLYTLLAEDGKDERGTQVLYSILAEQTFQTTQS
ncbi:MAG: NAD(P)-dependent oxidoreductase [Bacilli bacterium]